jgi:glutamate N-acetyltransferase/amino-acid N-acetyltransferase
MTTDTVMKVCEAEGQIAGKTCRIAGMAKGSGMIGPNMATMLGAVLTDAALTPDQAQFAIRTAAERSFNAIHVDGHTSTNDTVVLIASGPTHPLTSTEFAQFSEMLDAACIDLAKKIVDDGEGASHFIEIQITGARNDAEAKLFAASIANSPLVKTAIAGNDPNWGRIVSAAGYAAAPMIPERTSLRLNQVPLFRDGTPLAFDAAAVSTAMASRREVTIELCVGDGPGSSRYWTCDLTHEYVTINADYHT